MHATRKRPGIMSQCLLNTPVQSQQGGCNRQICIERRASSLQHARSHTVSSSKVASRSSTFTGRPVHANCIHKVARQQQPHAADAVICKAASDKMVIAVTGMSSFICNGQTSMTTCAHGCQCNAGATGLVGSRLVSRLSAQGHTVRVLTRNPDKARGKLPYARIRFYNIQQQLQEALNGATGVVNLAGTALYTHVHALPCSLPRHVKVVSAHSALI